MKNYTDSWQWAISRRIRDGTATVADIERWMDFKFRDYPGYFYETLIRLLLKRLTEAVAWSGLWKTKAKQLDKIIKQLTRVRVTDYSINERDGQDVTLRSETMHLFAGVLADWFIDAGGINYVEARLNSPKTGPLLFIVQRVEGKTPHELRIEAEDRIIVLEATIDKLEAR